MITWMQRHRKYLVVTIWISTIAFVGAGSVGWGALKYGKANSSAAKVGDTYISYKQLNFAYNNTFNEYNNMLNGQLTREKAEKMKLEQSVLANLINETLMLNFAKELGLKALDKDIKEILANDKTFQVDGVFNIELYKRILQNRNMSGNEYEKYLKRYVVLNKLQNIIGLEPNKDEINLLASTIFMEDKLSISILNANPNDIDMSDKKLKAFWEPIKSHYMTKKSYEIQEAFVGLDNISVNDKEIQELYNESKFNFTNSDGTIKSLEQAKDDVIKAVKFKKAKKSALLKYKYIKKGEENLTKSIEIQEDNTNYPVKDLATSNPNDILKPYEQDNGYVIAKLIKTNLPKPMSFEKAKPYVVNLYKKDAIKKQLKSLAEARLDMFQGKDIGYVSKDINSSIDGLTLQQTQEFVSKVFSNNAKKSYVILGDKVVLYDILAQNLLNNEKVKLYNERLTQMASNLENQEFQSNLLAQLRKRYKIEQYYKGK